MRFVFVTAIIVLLDQGVKQFILKWLIEPKWLLEGKIGLQLTMNEGVAFSLPITGLLSIIISLSIIGGLIYYYNMYTRRGFFTDIIFGLIIGGAIGNIIDRFIHGAVVDYIRIFTFPTFNIADSAITVGFLLLIFSFDRIRA